MAVTTEKGPQGTQPPAQSKAPFRAFKNRDFTLFWAASLMSITTFFMLMITRGQYMLDLTNSAFMVSAIQAVPGLPMLVLSMFGGVIADRFNRKKVLLTAEVVNLAANLALAVLVITDTIQVWQIFALAVVNGVAFSTSMPSRMASVPNMLPRQDIASGVAMMTTVFSGASMVGPALAGVLMSNTSMGIAFLVPSLLMLPATVCLLLSNVKHQPNAGTHNISMFRSIWEGVRWIKAQPIMMALMLIGFAMTVFGMPFQAMMPVISKDLLTEPGLGAALFGLPGGLASGLNPKLGLGVLGAIIGLGSVAGSIAVATFGESANRSRVLMVGSLGFALTLIAFALSPNFLLSCVLALVVGFLLQMFMTSNVTLVQMLSPDNIRGRVLSIRMIIFGLGPLGQLLIGYGAETMGTALATALMAVVCLVLTLVVFATYPSIRKL